MVEIYKQVHAQKEKVNEKNGQFLTTIKPKNLRSRLIEEYLR